MATPVAVRRSSSSTTSANSTPNGSSLTQAIDRLSCLGDRCFDRGLVPLYMADQHALDAVLDRHRPRRNRALHVQLLIGNQSNIRGDLWALVAQQSQHLGLRRVAVLDRVLRVDHLDINRRRRLVLEDSLDPIHLPDLVHRHVMRDHAHSSGLVLVIDPKVGRVHALKPPLLVRQRLDQTDEALLRSRELGGEECGTRSLRFSHTSKLAALTPPARGMLVAALVWQAVGRRREWQPRSKEQARNRATRQGRKRRSFRPKDPLNQVAIWRPDRRVYRLERIVCWFEKHLASAPHT